MMTNPDDAPRPRVMSEQFQADIKQAVVVAVRGVVSRYQGPEDYDPVEGRFHVLDGLWVVTKELWYEAVVAAPGRAQAWALRIVQSVSRPSRLH